jgi:hypothetical protein
MLWRSVASFTFQPFYHQCTSDRSLCAPSSRPAALMKEQITAPPTGNEPLFSSRSARSYFNHYNDWATGWQKALLCKFMPWYYPAFWSRDITMHVALSTFAYSSVCLLCVCLSSYDLCWAQYINITCTNQKLPLPARSQSFLIFLDHPKAAI